jgi:transmembrane protein 17
MLIYFNIYYFSVWFVGTLIVLVWKSLHFQVTIWNFYQSWIMFVAFSAVELVRLYLGFVGNLKEQVPELSGCILFAVFPQLFILIIATFFYQFFGKGFITPLEYSSNLIYIGFLVLEALQGYRAARDIVDFQTTEFFEKFDAGEYSAAKTA